MHNNRCHLVSPAPPLSAACSSPSPPNAFLSLLFSSLCTPLISCLTTSQEASGVASAGPFPRMSITPTQPPALLSFPLLSCFTTSQKASGVASAGPFPRMFITLTQPPALLSSPLLSRFTTSQEASGVASAGPAAALVMSIIPAHIMRSMGGGYDNESIAVTAMVAVFWLWCRSVRTPGSWPIAVLAGLAHVYMVAAWGGYVFVINMVSFMPGFPFRWTA